MKNLIYLCSLIALIAIVLSSCKREEVAEWDERALSPTFEKLNRIVIFYKDYEGKPTTSYVISTCERFEELLEKYINDCSHIHCYCSCSSLDSVAVEKLYLVATDFNALPDRYDKKGEIITDYNYEWDWVGLVVWRKGDGDYIPERYR